MKKIFLLVLPALFLFSACTDRNEKDEAIILDYLAENNLSAEKTAEGVYYIIEVEGTGAHPTITDQVEVNYEGYLIDGSIFDSSYDRGQSITFPLMGVILGWQYGIPKLKEGGKGKLLIPSQLAYGATPPSSSIPKNAVLIFDVELIDIK